MTLRLFFILALLVGSRLHAQEPTELRADLLEMVSDEQESRLLCVGNVLLTATNLLIACDRLEIIASRIGELDGAIPTLEKFKYLLATGNVRMVQGEREATCGRAEVFPREEKVVLTEEPVLIDHGSEIVQRGTMMTLLRGENRVHVENAVLTGPPIRDLGPDAKDESDADDESDAKGEPTPAPPAP